MTATALPVEKSEILFLYDSTYSIPNGDPFTGEQRYDEETKKVLVSDVRIKRYIRDNFIDNGMSVYVRNDRENARGKETGAEIRFNNIERALPPGTSARDVLTSQIDVRLFGGISTKTGDAINLTGPVQFALLNPSLNSVDLRMHQNTSVFASSAEKTRGAIGTTTVVPYSVNQIHGWVNPYAAVHTELTSADVNKMYSSLWNSVNNANTRSKSNQSSLLLIVLSYTDPTKKLYGLDRLIKLNSRDGKRDEQMRSIDDYELDLTALIETVKATSFVKSVQFYTEDGGLRNAIVNAEKFVEMTNI
jgi:CRISPR-associated protein Csh2